MKITVQTKSGEISFESDPGETLLAAGLRNGIQLPYECATGTCGTCKARIVKGEIDPGWINAPGRSYVNSDKGEVLMCQSAAGDDCIIHILNDFYSKDQIEVLCIPIRFCRFNSIREKFSGQIKSHLMPTRRIFVARWGTIFPQFFQLEQFWNLNH